MTEQNALTIPAIDDRGSLVATTLLEQAGQAANRAAARHVFDRYRERKADNTIRRQRADLALFAKCLKALFDNDEARDQIGDLETWRQLMDDLETRDLFNDPSAWRGVTWGLVQGFVKWMLDSGYSVGSVNVRLSTIKTYAKLAAQSGELTPQDYAMIRTVAGFKHGETKRLDERRAAAGQQTRIGGKKADPVTLSTAQAQALKDQPDTPQGRRDRLIMCILLDHGLRVGELAALTVSAINLDAGTMTFYREKVDLEQTHELSRDTLQAARAWLASDAPKDKSAPLLRGSAKGGALNGPGMGTRAITARVRTLGVAVGLYVERERVTPIRGAKTVKHGTLSAHDCRHTWATHAAKHTPLDRLMQAGGWSSPAMPLRYIKAAEIANAGVLLGYNRV